MWSYKQNKLLAIFLSVTVCKPNVEQFVVVTRGAAYVTMYDPWNRSVVCDNECGVFSVPEAARDDLRTRTMQIRQRHIKCARIEQKRPRKTKLIEISRHRVPRAAQNPVYPWDMLWDKLPGKISVFHRFFNFVFFAWDTPKNPVSGYNLNLCKIWLVSLSVHQENQEKTYYL